MSEYREKAPPSTTTKQKINAVHTIDSLAAQFGLTDMAIRRSHSQSTMTTDNEYRSYISGDLWDEDSDPLRFWEVSTIVRSFSIRRSLIFICIRGNAEQTTKLPYHIRNRHGLLADPGLGCTLRTRFFLKCGDRYGETQPNLTYPV